MTTVAILKGVAMLAVALLFAIVVGMCVTGLALSKKRKRLRDRHRQRVEFWGYE